MKRDLTVEFIILVLFVNIIAAVLVAHYAVKKHCHQQKQTTQEVVQ